MGRAAHLVALLGSLLVLLLAAPPADARTDASPQLLRRLETALAAPAVDPARTAALAVDLASGEVVFSRNASLSLLPASTTKVAVVYAALRRLGPGYRFRTEVRGVGRLDGSTWRGALVLQGFGDPTLGEGDLGELAAQVAAWGIRFVSGAVLADESWYDDARTAPGWKPSYYLGESPPLTALVAERARYRGRLSRTPALAAASLFRQALERVGVRVAKPTRLGRAPADTLPLAQDLSEPLGVIVRRLGRDSDNFAAELLLKELGAVLGTGGTTRAGAKVVRETLDADGVPLHGVRFADGSGLSLLDRVTAETLVALLRAGWADGEIRDAFVNSLAVAGVDGTLERRMQSLPARGRVVAKTGTTRRASGLAGLVRGRYAFAVLQNGTPVPTEAARRAQDRFATALADR